MGGGSTDRTRVAIAVNADSMSTWFTAVFDRLPEVLFDLRIEDQDHSARLLREGAVMGAVTTERAPVPGCRVHASWGDALCAGGQRRLSRALPVRGVHGRRSGTARRRWPGTATTHCRTC